MGFGCKPLKAFIKDSVLGNHLVRNDHRSFMTVVAFGQIVSIRNSANQTKYMWSRLLRMQRNTLPQDQESKRLLTPLDDILNLA